MSNSGAISTLGVAREILKVRGVSYYVAEDESGRLCPTRAILVADRNREELNVEIKSFDWNFHDYRTAISTVRREIERRDRVRTVVPREVSTVILGDSQAIIAWIDATTPGLSEVLDVFSAAIATLQSRNTPSGKS